MAIISNLLRLIAKPIFLKLGKGLKSSKTQYCLGDELDIRLDDSVIGKDNVIAKPPTRVNSLVRWVDGDGKQITDSKTIQDDDGTTETISTVDGELKQLIDNLSSSDSASVVQHLRSLVKTMIRQEIKNKQIWDTYIDATSKSYIVRGENLNDVSQKGNFFNIAPNGVVSRPFQPKGGIYLDSSSPTWAQNTNFKVGTNKAFTVITDEDGTDTSAGHFFPGGNGKELYYETNYEGKFYDVRFQFLVSTSANSFCAGRMFYNGFTYRTYATSGAGATTSIGNSYIIRSKKGQRISFELRIDGASPFMRVYDPFPVLENYIGIYMQD